MKLTARKSIARTYKLLAASGALALGLTLIPTAATAETRTARAQFEVVKTYETVGYKSHRSRRHSNNGRYDNRRHQSRRYDNRRHQSRRYDNRSHNSYRYRNDHHRPRYRSSPHFSIPRRLIRHQLRSLSQFFLGSFYYSGHHHSHKVYDFPVYNSGRVSYRTYAYCQGELYDQPYDDNDYDYGYDR